MSKGFRWKNEPALYGVPYCPTGFEQLANCITHMPCIAAAVACTHHLLTKSSTTYQSVIAWLYGLSIIGLFTASSLFHACCLVSGMNCRVRNALHICDRIVIFIFIAASYTPWLALREFNACFGSLALCIVWACALLGCVFQFHCHDNLPFSPSLFPTIIATTIYRYKWLEITLYVTMGSFPALAFLQMHNWRGLYLLALGGACYAAGIPFFKLDGRIPLAHAIWHCFVVTGSYIQFSAVEKYLITPSLH